MESILLFAPLVGAILCGFGHRAFGERNALMTSTGLLFLSAILSWAIFLTHQGQTDVVPVFRWVESGSLSDPDGLGK